MKKDVRSRKDSNKNPRKKSSFRTRQNKNNPVNDGKIRLNKFIANTGICSRREADKFIKAGIVTVNNVSVTTMGYRVSSTDQVKFNGQRLKLSQSPLKTSLLCPNSG